MFGRLLEANNIMTWLDLILDPSSGTIQGEKEY